MSIQTTNISARTSLAEELICCFPVIGLCVSIYNIDQGSRIQKKITQKWEENRELLELEPENRPFCNSNKEILKKNSVALWKKEIVYLKCGLTSTLLTIATLAVLVFLKIFVIQEPLFIFLYLILMSFFIFIPLLINAKKLQKQDEKILVLLAEIYELGNENEELQTLNELLKAENDFQKAIWKDRLRQYLDLPEICEQEDPFMPPEFAVLLPNYEEIRRPELLRKSDYLPILEQFSL